MARSLVTCFSTNLHPRVGERASGNLVLQLLNHLMSTLTAQLARQPQRQPFTSKRHDFLCRPRSFQYTSLLWPETPTALSSCYPPSSSVEPGRVDTRTGPACQILQGPMWHVPAETRMTYIEKLRHDRSCHQQSCILPPESHPPPHLTGTAGPCHTRKYKPSLLHPRPPSPRSASPIFLPEGVVTQS